MQIPTKKRFRSLAVTLAVAFLVLSVSVMLLSTISELSFSFQAQQEIIANQQRLIAQGAANAVKNFIDTDAHTLQEAADLGNLASSSPSAQRLAMDRLLGSDSEFRQLLVLDAHGNEVQSVSRLSTADNPLTPAEESDLLTRTQQGDTYISPVYIDTATNEPLVLMAVPTRDLFKESDGALVAEVDLKFMWDLVGTLQVGQHGVAYVVDREGNLLAFGDTSRVLARENLKELGVVQEFLNNDTTPSASIHKGILGTNVITSFVGLGTPDWAVVVELPVFEAYASVVRILLYSLLVLFLGAIFAVVSGVYLSRRITRGLVVLNSAAEKIREGKLSTRVEISPENSYNEIGTLSVAFNQMAAHLAEHTSELEEEIAARTADLEKKLEELNRANERLLELDKAKSEFISVAAHQLRTPLSAIKWTLSMLIDENTENLTADQKSLLMRGYESNERILSLINEMLVVTRIEAGKMQYNLAPLHLEDVIESVLLDFAGQAHVRHMNLAFERPATHSPYVSADPDMMRSVVQNIVENAIRYTPDGGTINVSMTSSTAEVTVAIKDSGIGIPPQQRSSIFNKFFRADNAARFRTDGSGLGLYIVKSFVEKHGGKIWFDSSEGKGTTFFFTTPAADPSSVVPRAS